MYQINLKNRRGFTLIEAIVALAIFVIIATFSFPIFLSSSRVNHASYTKLELQEFSENNLERIREYAKVTPDQDQFTSQICNQFQTHRCEYINTSKTLNIYSDEYLISFIFIEDGNTVKVIGESLKNGLKYETVGWITYGS